VALKYGVVWCGLAARCVFAAAARSGGKRLRGIPGTYRVRMTFLVSILPGV